MDQSENVKKGSSWGGLFKNKRLWIVILAVVAIVLLIVLTDWNGFTAGFDKGFNSIE